MVWRSLACSTPINNIEASDATFPVAKAEPCRIGRIRGTVPSSTEVTLTAYYVAEKRKGCTYMMNWIEGVSTPFHIEQPLGINRTNGVFAGSVVVDRFEPGAFGWRLSSLVLSPSRQGVVSLPSGILWQAGDSHFSQQRKAALAADDSLWDETPMDIDCDFSPINRIADRMISVACSVNGVRGGEGKVLNVNINQVTLRITDSTKMEAE